MSQNLLANSPTYLLGYLIDQLDLYLAILYVFVLDLLFDTYSFIICFCQNYVARLLGFCVRFKIDVLSLLQAQMTCVRSCLHVNALINACFRLILGSSRDAVL